MLMTSCKGCEKEIYVHVEICPYCGIKTLKSLYEEEIRINEIRKRNEERMLNKIRDKEDEIDFYQNQANRLSKGLFNRMFFRWDIEESNRRANHAREDLIQLKKELEEIKTEKIHIKN